MIRGLISYAALAVSLITCWTGAANACVGLECLQVWSDRASGGSLVLRYDLTKKVQTYLGVPSVCTPETASCLYTANDPGFRAEPEDDPSDDYYPLADGTKVILELFPAEGQPSAVDEGLSIHINGRKLSESGDSASLGTTPSIHSHPSWQIAVDGGETGDYRLSFRLRSDPPVYDASPVYTIIVTNVALPPQSPTPTPSPRRTPTGRACRGDCSDDGLVVVNELVVCVNLALERAGGTECGACDGDRDGRVAVSELVAAVNAALAGCIRPPRATFADVQQMIFAPSCAMELCHDAVSATGGLVLDEANAHEQLVGIPPTTFAANAAGLLRVAAGDPDRSFLLVKLLGPPPDQGSRMPLALPPLDPEQIDLVRRWIEQGAPP